MKIILLTVGHTSPPWLQQGMDEYLKRFVPPHDPLTVVHIPPSVHTNKKARLTQEAKRFDEHMKKPGLCLALNRTGKPWSSEALAQQIKTWRCHHTTLYCCIGGADGFCPMWLNKATEQWSLSALTFPHTWSRLMVIEQLYRAYAIIANHPYHRS